MRINQLTFFRFLAAMAIVVLHFGMQTYPFSLSVPQAFLKLTNCLLAFFFMLSGFVLAVSNFSRPLIKKNFYFNRFVRIYPLYLFAIIFLVLARVLAGDQLTDVSLKHVVTNLTLTQSILTENALSLNYPGWSLSAEACFYILFPFLFQLLMKMPTRTVIWSCSLFWALSVLISILSIEFFKAPYHFTQYFAGYHLNAFVIGVAAGIIFMKHNAEINKLRNELVFWTTVLSFVYAVLVLTDSQITFYSNSGVFSPLFLTVILAFSTDFAPFKKILNSKILVLLGEASYSIYILQYAVWMLFYLIATKFQMSFLNNFYACCAGLVLISITTYLFLEKPLVGKYKAPKRQAAP